VIGGSGFFGKSILDAWQRGLLDPWGVTRIIAMARDTGVLRRDFPHLLGDHVTLVDGDVTRVREVPRADYVIHAASSTDARRYVDFPQEERTNILRAVDNFALAAADAHRDSRIVYCSSGAVYGQQPPSLDRVDEAYRPGDVAGMVAYKRDYAEAKRLAEQRIAGLGEAGMRVAVARCFAFVGLYLPRDQHFAIGNFLGNALRGEAVEVKARHAVYRSYMHADDLVRWLMAIADGATPGCLIYNVGSDEATLLGNVARLVAERFGVPAIVPAIHALETDRYIPSVDRARRRLGLALTCDLAGAIEDMAMRLQDKRR
jgi:dTDP-glucose 4,6-dehydratase